MFRKTLITMLLMLSLLLLGACGNAASEDDTSADNSSDTTTTTDGDSQATAAEGINATVTGDVEVTIEDGTHIVAQDDGIILLVFMQSMATMTTGVTIDNLPYPESVPVTYDLVTEDGVTGEFEFENDPYTENISGSITIDTFDETMSGTYSFTAEYTPADGETRSVSVEGSFSDVNVPEQSE